MIVRKMQNFYYIDKLNWKETQNENWMVRQEVKESIVNVTC